MLREVLYIQGTSGQQEELDVNKQNAPVHVYLLNDLKEGHSSP